MRETDELRALYEHLAQAEEDIRLGRVQDAEDVFDELVRELSQQGFAHE